jgi:hypothetical protein
MGFFFTLRRHIEALEDRHLGDYFNRPLLESFSFRSALSVMIIDELIGIYVICNYWVVMSPFVRVMFVIAMISLVVALYHVVSQHRKMSKLSGLVPTEGQFNELLRVCARSTYRELIALVQTSTALFVCCGMTAKHLAIVSASMTALVQR